MTARTYTPMEPVRPGEAGVRCQWFLWCSRTAVVEISHPVLGGVPTCFECSQRVRGADA